MARVENFNPEDIVGKQFGPCKVIEYIGYIMQTRPNGRQQKRHKYKVQCLQCRQVKVVFRAELLGRLSKQEYCRDCYKRLRLSRLDKKNNNPQDIVGKTFRGVKVVNYLGEERKWTENEKRYKYEYEVQCQKCGNVTVRTREGILSMAKREADGCACQKCNWQQRLPKVLAHTNSQKQSASLIETWDKRNMESQEPAKWNITTGIRHYTIVHCRRKVVASITTDYRHVVGVRIDNKYYKLFDKNLGSQLDDKCISLANELNEVLLAGGKEAFLKWYEKGEWKC